MWPNSGGGDLKIVILTYVSRRRRRNDLFAKNFEENEFANHQEDSECRKSKCEEYIKYHGRSAVAAATPCSK